MRTTYTIQRKKEQTFNFPAFLTIALLAFVHFFYLNIFDLDIPWGNDFYSIFESSTDFLSIAALSEKLSPLSKSWTDQSFLYSKLEALVSYAFLGKLDFKVFILLENLHLLGVLYLLFQLLKQWKFNLIFALPIAFLLLQPQSYEGLYWADTTFAYMTVIFYSLLSIYLLNKENWLPFWFCMFTTSVALYAFNSGLLVIPVGFCTLLLRSQFQRLLIWSIFSTSILIFFFQHASYPAALGFNLLTKLKTTPQSVFTYLFSFLGSISNYHEYPQTLTDHALPLQVGILISTVLFLTLIARIIRLNLRAPNQRESNLLWTFIGFTGIVVGSALTFALAHDNTDLIYTYTNRYKIYSSVFISLMYIGLLLVSSENTQKVVVVIFTIACLFFCLFNYYHYSPKIKKMRDDLYSVTFNWQENGLWLIHRETNSFEKSANFISEKRDSSDSTYHFAEIFPYLSEQVATDTITKIQLTIVHHPDNTYWITSYQPRHRTFEKSTFLVLQSDNNTFLLSVNPSSNSLEYFRKGFDIYKTGYSVNVSLKDLPPGNYRVGEFNELSNSVAFSDITLSN